MNKLNDLLKKCYKHKLDFILLSGENSAVTIYDTGDGQSIHVTRGVVKGDRKINIDEDLSHMHKELDEYIKKKHESFVDELIEEVGEWKA